MENLVKKLRNCTAEERPSLAIELAKTGTEKAFHELKRMAEGKKGWFTRYTLDDQLAAVTALGETGLPQALQYLRKVYTPVKTNETISFGSSGSTYKTKLEYPHTRGELAEALRSEHETDSRFRILDKGRAYDGYTCIKPEDEKARRAFVFAINRLIEAIENS
jgi:hypothetical protein